MTASLITKANSRYATSSYSRTASTDNVFSKLDSRCRRILLAQLNYVPAESPFPPGYSPELAEFDLGELQSSTRLTLAQEAYWFSRLNLVKQHADEARVRLDPESPDPHLIERIEALLAEADEIRNALLLVFEKLVVSIATRMAGPEHDFDELISEGIWTLLLAFDKFDVSRGFRFSTYATHAIRRNILRFQTNLAKQQSRAVNTEFPEELPDANNGRNQVDEDRWSTTYDVIEQYLTHLDDREQVIVRARFGLTTEHDGVTLRSLAADIGLSRERVRQIEQKAIAKLRDLAQTEDFDPFDTAVLS